MNNWKLKKQARVEAELERLQEKAKKELEGKYIVYYQPGTIWFPGEYILLPENAELKFINNTQKFYFKYYNDFQYKTTINIANHFSSTTMPIYTYDRAARRRAYMLFDSKEDAELFIKMNQE